jgi:NAD-dependent deacetylase sirtuin 4
METEIAQLIGVLQGRRVVALTGAGCSTESGIPDYRGPGTRARARNPIQHRAFLSDPAARARYWARSTIGWPQMSSAPANPAHRALAVLENEGPLVGVLTQNVDRLHRAAGSRRVIELHGALAEVRCMDCSAVELRHALQERLLALNPSFAARAIEFAPDGDAELPLEVVRDFRVASCLACGGTLKPDVVFFGDNVPATRVAAAFALLEEAEALLVVGSSLAVFSGFRFVRRAVERSMPIAIINQGESRADELARVRIDARAGEVLPRLAAGLGLSA